MITSGKIIPLAAMVAFIGMGGAQAQTGGESSAPTRGFALERGTVASEDTFSVDLATGAFNTGGGIRIGLPNSELLLNQNLHGAGANEGVLKWRMSRFEIGDGKPVLWALYGGIAHIDDDAGQDYTDFVFGGAFTTETENAIFDFNPELVLTDSDPNNSTALNLGFGAHFKMPENRIGRFQPGAEIVFINGPDNDDTEITLGVRWLFHDRATLDLAVVNLSVNGTNRDINGIPGIARLNVVF